MSGDRLCIDLCSGLGGFSRAFKDAGWEVVTVDINPKFNPTVIADLTSIDWRQFKKDYIGNRHFVLLASPPCERFSVACHTWPREGIKKAMEIIGACFEAVAILKPDYWVIENPKGRARWFLGSPNATIRLSDFGAPWRKFTDLWGNVELGYLKQEGKPVLYLRPMKQSPYHQSRSMLKWTPGHSKEKRAEMPIGLSQAVLAAIESSVESA